VKCAGTGVDRTRALLTTASSSISTPSPSGISIPSTLHHLFSIPDHPPPSFPHPRPSFPKHIIHSKTITTTINNPTKPQWQTRQSTLVKACSQLTASAHRWLRPFQRRLSYDQQVMCRAQHVTNADLLSAMFAGSQATSAHQPRQRVSGHKMPSEKLAEFNEERAAKRARTAAFAANQLAHPPRPFVEDAYDEDDGPIYQPGRRGRRPVDRQPGDQTQVTPNAAGKKPDAGPSRAVTDQPQGFQDVQPGKISLFL
jgi:hypothetical protein